MHAGPNRIIQNCVGLTIVLSTVYRMEKGGYHTEVKHVCALNL